MASRRWPFVVGPLLLVGAACAGRRGPHDVDNTHPRSTFPNGPGGAGENGAHLAKVDAGKPALARPRVAGRRPRVLVRATTRAIATRGLLVYFGDAEEDGLYTIPKAGGDPTRVGHRAPVAHGLAVERDAVVWIGSPGDTVFRTTGSGGTAAVVREHGIFTAVVGGGEIWLTEAHGSGGTLLGLPAGTTMASGRTAVTSASFDSAPRGLAADGGLVFVATQTKLLAVRRGRGDLETVTTGEAFGSPVVGAEDLYVTVASGRGRALVRVRKTGGAPVTVAASVRDAPIAIGGGDTVYWFDADTPTLLGRGPADGAPRIVSQDESYERAVAMTVDEDGVFVATGTSDDGLVQIVPLR